MRAIEPHTVGFATNPRDSVRIAYEVFGPPDAERTIALLPSWSFGHSRFWKMQVPYFARQGFRVLTFDGRGNGRSDRPPSGYTTDHFAQDTLAVLDAVDVERAALVGLSAGSSWGLQLAAEHPERVTHLVLIGPSVKLDGTARVDLGEFLAEPPDREGWHKYNAVHWREQFRNFAEWFSHEIICEAHSTKAIEETTGRALETTPDVLIATIVEGGTPRAAEFAAAVRCPTLIIQGSEDRAVPLERGIALHEAIPGSSLVVVEGAGHVPNGRDPVRTNLLIHDFLGREQPERQNWRRALTRTKRALFVSSPIGLGHVRRDLAIADELRALVPGLEIDWLAQPPVTTVLAARGECIHPLSERLAGESAHIESELSGPHRLHVFQAFRNMDEILLSNFMVFLDAARQGAYDLWVGDEAWDLDYYLHENPELKSAPFAWLTDFVGYLPVDPDPAGRDAYLTADYNAEMLEQVARFPRVRDAALFIGDPDDVVPDRFGDGLPLIRDWTKANFEFSGYVRPFDPEDLGSRDQLRQEFGFRPGECIAVASAGGTGVGSDLLRRIVEAYPVARDQLPELRLVVVCGPRIDPAALPAVPGVEYRGYVPDLYRMLAAADVALVQGGLSTTMELVAARRPFLSFPLTDHYEQVRHVAYRLERYGVPAWAQVPFPEASPETIADRLACALREPVAYRPVEAGGARRAAERLARLV